MGRKYTKRLSKRLSKRRKNTLKSRVSKRLKVSKRKNTLNRRKNTVRRLKKKRTNKKRLFKGGGGVWDTLTEGGILFERIDAVEDDALEGNQSALKALNDLATAMGHRITGKDVIKYSNAISTTLDTYDEHTFLSSYSNIMRLLQYDA
jgi:hypothetical protein